MRSSTCVYEASLWTGSSRAMCYPASRTSVTVSSAACPLRTRTCTFQGFITCRRKRWSKVFKLAENALSNRNPSLTLLCSYLCSICFTSGFLLKAGTWMKPACFWWLMPPSRGLENWLRWINPSLLHTDFNTTNTSLYQQTCNFMLPQLVMACYLGSCILMPTLRYVTASISLPAGRMVSRVTCRSSGASKVQSSPASSWR